ncbi:MBL fold metallo-hydrolase [Paractinoplanes hotanensis]|uniref:MBL fold metallo-hydrolase n=1 Tax=Paractinoplanes hotanensis TaxID=2906497 RepID=A0ABT0YFX8_9ACTN|nr:MBL fold metallo-hydrolase [Actinoplanes hotanensis]MCM4084956.1 MBL fold metallo-hydrolase [Actinoplanes hotanensis]
MREVIDGVFELGLGFVNMHLVVTDDGVVLVDTGLPRNAQRIDRALHRLRKQIGDVTAVLLTHQHVDHIGNVADVRRRAGARVFAHAADAAGITGAIRPPEPKGLARFAVRLIGSAEPTKLDHLITAEESEPLPGFTAIHTPGHTRGHVSYLLDRAGGILFAGDTASGTKDGKVTSGPTQASADPAQQGRSLAKLGTYEFEHAVFGHGKAVSGHAAERFREYAGSAGDAPAD